MIRRVADDAGEANVAGLTRALREFEQQTETLRRRSEGEQPSPLASPAGVHSIVGRSVAVADVVRLVRQAAPSTLSVLVTGETGTGKELVARAIHGESSRASGPFLSINCAAIPEELLEAELFGYRKGAFSGADRDYSGLLIGADGGTFLFDEITELSLGLQGKLLRVLDTGSVRSLGSVQETSIDVRYVFTTNQDVRRLVAENEFRADLLFRLSGVEIPVPPLRERLDDLPLLIDLCRSICGVEPGMATLDEEAKNTLAMYPWPGNVRELNNVVTRLVLSGRPTITADDVRPLLNEGGDGAFSLRPYCGAGRYGSSLPSWRRSISRSCTKIAEPT